MPKIKFNYMSKPSDWDDFRKCIRLVRRIFAQKAFDSFRGTEIQPGIHVQTDKELNDFIRENVESAYHPCGTCKMGFDEMAVVDVNLKVKGIQNLRVIDASVIPEIPSANLNAPTLMIAEKGADSILN